MGMTRKEIRKMQGKMIRIVKSTMKLMDVFDPDGLNEKLVATLIVRLCIHFKLDAEELFTDMKGTHLVGRALEKIGLLNVKAEEDMWREANASRKELKKASENKA